MWQQTEVTKYQGMLRMMHPCFFFPPREKVREKLNKGNQHKDKKLKQISGNKEHGVSVFK